MHLKQNQLSPLTITHVGQKFKTQKKMSQEEVGGSSFSRGLDVLRIYAGARVTCGWPAGGRVAARVPGDLDGGGGGEDGQRSGGGAGWAKMALPAPPCPARLGPIRK